MSGASERQSRDGSSAADSSLTCGARRARRAPNEADAEQVGRAAARSSVEVARSLVVRRRSGDDPRGRRRRAFVIAALCGAAERVVQLAEGVRGACTRSSCAMREKRVADSVFCLGERARRRARGCAQAERGEGRECPLAESYTVLQRSPSERSEAGGSRRRAQRRSRIQALARGGTTTHSLAALALSPSPHTPSSAQWDAPSSSAELTAHLHRLAALARATAGPHHSSQPVRPRTPSSQRRPRSPRLAGPSAPRECVLLPSSTQSRARSTRHSHELTRRPLPSPARSLASSLSSVTRRFHASSGSSRTQRASSAASSRVVLSLEQQTVRPKPSPLSRGWLSLTLLAPFLLDPARLLDARPQLPLAFVAPILPSSRPSTSTTSSS